MGRTNLTPEEHTQVVRECGGVIPYHTTLLETILSANFPKKELGTVGVALRIAAIQAWYR